MAYPCLILCSKNHKLGDYFFLLIVKKLYALCFMQPVVVSSTGGLVDTIVEGKTGFHMGRFSAKVCMIQHMLILSSIIFAGTLINLSAMFFSSSLKW